jgi:aminoglycoside 6'-N-acetyltransferase I
MEIRHVVPADQDEWVRLCNALLPSDDHAHEIAAHFAEGSPRAVFVADRGDGRLAGFIEVGTRDVAEGCWDGPVGYIEAWYVDADVRRTGVGRALIARAEEWARARGLTEMASDALIDNEVSEAAHIANGYEVVERIVCFRKRL